MGRQLYSDKRELVRELLRQVRKDAGITQADLSSMLGRPQSYVSDYERGHRRLDWVAIDEVLGACGYSIVKFVKDYVTASADLINSSTN